MTPKNQPLIARAQRPFEKTNILRFALFLIVEIYLLAHFFFVFSLSLNSLSVNNSNLLRTCWLKFRQFRASFPCFHFIAVLAFVYSHRCLWRRGCRRLFLSLLQRKHYRFSVKERVIFCVISLGKFLAFHLLSTIMALVLMQKWFCWTRCDSFDFGWRPPPRLKQHKLRPSLRINTRGS